MNTGSALSARGLHKTFRRETGETVPALTDVSLEIRRGTLSALVGPDGAGKTTLLRLAAGLLTPGSGTLEVLGIDVGARPQAVQDRIGYMPQRFGLYEDLSVQDNLDLYADLHGISASDRRARYPRLMEMTRLGNFRRRLAGQLSGGMKQKLGLACTLVYAPPLLLLDEPTVGVDPLSRRELWDIIVKLVEGEGQTVLLSTAYLHEAERCAFAAVLHEGRVLVQGNPAELTALAQGRSFLATPRPGTKARTLQSQLLHARGVVDAVPQGGCVRVVLDHTNPGTAIEAAVRLDPVPPRFEDGFMTLLQSPAAAAGEIEFGASAAGRDGQVVVKVQDLVRLFGSFTAVDHVGFEVRRGEIFGLLGPNGAGKTTCFRMLCGLLPASGGMLEVAGRNLRQARASGRQSIGYVAQKFSLYGQLTVAENLEFFAAAYGLRAARLRQRMAWAVAQFQLEPLLRLPAGQLPGGYKQRLAMAAALMHEPEILFLDEPTSGADPHARRGFWQRITALAEAGVTVIVTTHFMEEAEYCDRVVILDSGRLLAQGTPAEVRRQARRPDGSEADMEDAFIGIVEATRRNSQAQAVA